MKIGGMAAVAALCLQVVAAPAVAQSPSAPAASLSAKSERGKAVYEYWCSSCHGAGQGMFGAKELPGTAALRAKYQGAIPPLLVDRRDMPADFVRVVVRQGMSIMPYFRKTEISDAELDALAAYLSAK
jgi:mono/diheme cytochrome c family protein